MKQLLVALLLAAAVVYAGEMKNLNIGDDVPSFSLRNYDGKQVDLKSVEKENKFTVVMFISTECPVSNGYNERMEQLYDAYSKKGIAVLGINANKAEDVVRIAEHSKEHGFKFPVLKDVNNKVADLYNAQVTPEVFVISQSGKLLYHGRIDDSRNIAKVTSHDLTDALDKLLAGKELTVKEPKAFGCSIKRIDS